jgi:uncharacterized FAD-dependent dehydrogenase
MPVSDSRVRDSEVTWRIRDLWAAIDETEPSLRARALAEVGLGEDDLRSFRIARRSLDARRRRGARSLRFALQADVVLREGAETDAFARARKAGRVVRVAEPGRLVVDDQHPSLSAARVAVVGSGPAGLFAALVLARNGVSVDLLDRGAPLPERGRAVAGFLRSRVPDPDTNLLYGEGGAGTYSDGKLYTRIDHPLEAPLLDVLIAAGAPAEIAVDARAHIGTDRLHRILPVLRRDLEANGVRFHWHTRLEGIDTADSPRRVRALRTNRGEIPVDALILAPGHSARDSLRALVQEGLLASAKPFQFGVRVEHPQDLITRARHGTSAEAAALGPAYYGLVCRAGQGLPAAHSFCMCPGGQIVASVSAPGFLCTNGMSNSRHSSPWANAAIVVTLGPADFGPGAFDGVGFQEEMESAFFESGGGDYRAPAQRVPDFLSGRESRGDLASSYKLGVAAGRIDALLPERVRDALKRALLRFDRQLPGFAGPEGLLVGVESRSSGPLRLPRDPQTRLATGFANLYPVGEGAGYAGGIMSAAIDGARSAQSLLSIGVRGPTSSLAG